MRKNLAGLVLPLALFGCGTPLVWQGPSGADLGEVRRDCEHRAEAWRQHSELMYQYPAVIDPTQIRAQPRATDERYRAADQVFADCMRDQGFTLVARDR